MFKMLKKSEHEKCNTNKQSNSLNGQKEIHRNVKRQFERQFEKKKKSYRIKMSVGKK